MFTVLKPFICPEINAVKFAIKVSISAAISLFIAFCLDLEQPQWAAATAVIVAQPLSGMVVSKGLARLFGTILGTIVAFIITGLFDQTPWLFILAMAVWLVICTAASTVIRSVWAYSFMLAGYSAAIIVLPNIFNPLGIFDYAIARCTEICLGIICTSLVFALIWPVRVFQGLLKEATNLREAGLISASTILKGEHSGISLLSSLSKIVAVDTQREQALFEGGDGRNRAKSVQNMSLNILTLLRVARGVARQWDYISYEAREQLKPWLDECTEQLDKGSYRGLLRLNNRLKEISHLSRSVEQQDIFVRLEMVTRYAAMTAVDLSSVRKGKVRRKTKPNYLSIHRDYSLGLFFGLRTGIAFFILAIFWMLWGWPINEASGSLMMVAVTCSLFANRENAAQISMGFFRGVCYAVVIAFIVSQLIIPSWSGFPLLWLAIGIPLFISSLGMVNPAIAGTCTVFSINIVMLCRPTNHSFQSTEAFINQGLAMPLGVIAATLAFNLVKINTQYWQGKYMLNVMLKDLRRLAQGSVGGIETWFGGRMADRLILLARHKQLMSDNAEKRWNDALHVIDIGDELLNLRMSLLGQKTLEQDLYRYLEKIADVFENSPNKRNTRRLNRASEKFKRIIKERNFDTNMLLAVSSIEQLQQVWANWYQEQMHRQEEQYGNA